MPQDLIDIIRRKKAEGLSAIAIQKWLRDNNYAIPWVETQKLFNQA